MKSQGTSKAGEMDWEKELAFLVPADVYSRNQFGGTTRRSKLSDEEIEDLYAFVRRVIAQERERIESGHILSQDNGVVGGKIRFTGTRIPVQLVAEYEAKGHSLDEIINDIFPSLKDLHIITNNHEDHKE